nr:MAG TPA: hypothetical protein [Caudoviricetes sp.]
MLIPVADQHQQRKPDIFSNNHAIGIQRCNISHRFIQVTVEVGRCFRLCRQGKQFQQTILFRKISLKATLLFNFVERQQHGLPLFFGFFLRFSCRFRFGFRVRFFSGFYLCLSLSISFSFFLRFSCRFRFGVIVSHFPRVTFFHQLAAMLLRGFNRAAFRNDNTFVIVGPDKSQFHRAFSVERPAGRRDGLRASRSRSGERAVNEGFRALNRKRQTLFAAN